MVALDAVPSVRPMGATWCGSIIGCRSWPATVLVFLGQAFEHRVMRRICGATFRIRLVNLVTFPPQPAHLREGEPADPIHRRGIIPAVQGRLTPELSSRPHNAGLGAVLAAHRKDFPTAWTSMPRACRLL